MSFGYRTTYEGRANHGGFFGDKYLSRTGVAQLPYTRQYKTDGTGRDTYIGFDNGGFNIMYTPYKQAELGTFGGGKGKSKFYHRTSSKPTYKIVNYPQDGTGRDTYVLSNNGGFLPEREPGALRKNFFDKFRQYENRPSTQQYLEKRGKKSLKLTSEGKIVMDRDIFLNT